MGNSLSGFTGRHGVHAVEHVPDSPRFSIVICTRNPREAAFRRVLAAIEAQTFPATERELIVVDSSSSPNLRDRDLPWPAGVRFVRLEQSGIAKARVAGVQAAKGDWIVFVDDDNVLDADYLEQAAEIMRLRPDVRLFCGRISGEFESQPPEWLREFHRQLAIIDFREDTSASRWEPEKIPCWTAGMCVRTCVVRTHFEEAMTDPFFMAIQTRVEDVYLVMRAVQKGHTAGLFRKLHLTHLIPTNRMTPTYLGRIAHETSFNMFVLRWRDQGLSWRDFLRPVKAASIATLRHGWSPRGRIARAAAAGECCGAFHCLINRPRAGRGGG